MKYLVRWQEPGRFHKDTADDLQEVIVKLNTIRDLNEAELWTVEAIT
jgi:hypothetical protein